MRWKNSFIYYFVIFFSLAFFIITLMNFLGPMHPQIFYIDGNESHPPLYAAYLIISELIIWSLYFAFRKRASLSATIVVIFVGISLIFLGTMLWDIGIRFENVIIPLAAKRPVLTGLLVNKAI